MHFLGPSSREQSLLLTVTGPAQQFADRDGGVLRVIRDSCGSHTLQRFDIEAERAQVRIGLRQIDPLQTAALIVRLREQLPECEISMVDLRAIA